MSFTGELMERCIAIIKENIQRIEDSLKVFPKWEVLPEVKADHLHLEKSRLLMGVFSAHEELISIYPLNIWEERCGVLPEPCRWDMFEEQVRGVLAHEMRHMWQLKNGTYDQEDAEWDANNYAMDYLFNETPL